MFDSWTQSETRPERRQLIWSLIVLTSFSKKSTLIALQWEYDWIDVVDIAMAVWIA
jgi:hypothetical protein